MAHTDSPLILVIMADPSDRQELADLLAGTTFRLQFAESAEDGLLQAETLLPAMVLLDIDVRRLNTFETCRRLRAIPALASAPILMFNDHADRDSRALGLSAGADDFVEKPFDGLELLARVSTILRLNLSRVLLTDLSRFTWMAEHAQEGYLMLDMAGAIQYANERAAHLLNLPEDFTGLPFVQVVEQMYVPEPVSAWSNWIDEPEPCFLIQPEGPTARAVWVVIESLDTRLAGEQHRLVRLRDVTERMAIYQDMRRFHMVVSHKLRTPMSIMYTNLSIIKKRLDMLSPDEVKDYARSTIDNADRLVSEIRQILTYIDAPLSLTIGESFKLDGLPETLFSVSKALELDQVFLSLPEELRVATLAMTQYAIEMILHELLDNARKFHPSHAPQVQVSVAQMEEGYVRFRFVDDGIPLSPEQMTWAFLPYFQSEKDFTGELPGMGLGVPMVATLVWQCGGDIHLRNRPDCPGVIVDLKIPFESTMRNMQRSAQPFMP